MDDDAPEPAQPATALAGALLSGAAALAMAGAAHTLRPPVSHVLGEDVLIAWVLVACAAIGVLFCVYLTVIWGLAAAVMAAGPASRLGAALFIALRVLAPRVARRVVVSTALAATATGLALAPATAADRSLGADAVSPIPAAVSSELTPSDSSEPGTGAEAETDTDTDTEAGTGADDPSSTAASDGQGTEPGPLPGLGWGGEDQGEVPSEPEGDGAEDSGAAAPESSENEAGESAPSSTTDADPRLPVQPSPPGHDSSPAPAQSAPAPSTVVVQSGDTLWSITDDLLGPVPDSPSEIAAVWPLLHESNLDVIGTDPDLLEPGQELLVPAPLSSQEQ
ncbi:MAG: LysM peptidoglycan-binding domain-containing protein [Brachybacterium tyrofermentans]